MRDCFGGVRRFSDFKARLGVSTNILSERLNALCEAGVLDRRPTRPGVSRMEYRLTEKGRDLATMLIALWQWGERWAFAPGQSPVTVRAKDTGEGLAPLTLQTQSGRALALNDLEMVAAPAASAITRKSYDALKRSNEGGRS